MKPLAQWTMNELLEACPGAVTVLEAHGVNPLTRCHHGVRNYLKLGQVLGKTCPVDDVAATLKELEALLAEPAKEGSEVP